MHILLYAVLPLILLLFFVSSRKKDYAIIEADTKRPYHAIIIHPCKNACECAKRIQGKRVLSSDFVSMKLNDCARPNCDCTFEHFDDRRTGVERRNFAEQVFPIFAEQRQQPYGRRVADVHNKARASNPQLQAQKRQTISREFGSILTTEQE